MDMSRLLSAAVVALAFVSVPVLADWETWDLARARVVDCLPVADDGGTQTGQDEATGFCAYVDSADPRTVELITGIVQVERDADGEILTLAVYGTMLRNRAEAFEINYFLPVIRSINKNKVLLIDDGERSTAYVLQNTATKFAFSLDYDREGLVEYFKAKAF